MLNLRHSARSREGGVTNSEVRHFSRFSINFRVPSDLLGNIGESLDYSQSERLYDDDNPQINSSRDDRSEIHSPAITYSNLSDYTQSGPEDRNGDQSTALGPARTPSNHEL